MSESAAASVASVTPAATSAPTSAPSTGQASQAQPSGASGAGAQGQVSGSSQSGQPSESAQAQAARELGDSDMDALVTLKINGETVKKPLREAIKLSQLEQASYEKMKRAAEAERQYQLKEAQFKQWANDPETLFKQLGKNFDDVATDYFAKKYELAQMSPEQRKLMEAEQKLQQYEANERKSKADVVSALKEYFPEVAEDKLYSYSREELVEALNQKQDQVKQAESQVQQELIQAWEATGLPKHKWFGAQMAFAMMNHQKSTKSPLLAKDAALKVKSDFNNFVKDVVKQMDAKSILEFFGDEAIEKIRKYEVERVSQKPSEPVKPEQGPSDDASQKKPMNLFEYRKFMGYA